MKKIALCLLAAALCTGTAAAQDYRDDSGRYDQRYDRDRGDRYDPDDRYDRDERYDRYDRDGRYDRRDEILPRQYLRERYVFNGWRERGLKQPGRGQEWIRVCDAYILASMRSGRIEEVHMRGRGRVDNKPQWRLANSLRCRR